MPENKVDLKKWVKWHDKIHAYALENAMTHGGKAQAGNVISHLFREGLEREDVKDIISTVNEAVAKINSMSPEEQKIRFEEVSNLVKKPEEKEKGLPELPGIVKKVVMRLAPFPSGALHIGNAKTYLLNALYAEKYKGKLLLVMDDTIGSKEKQVVKEAYKLIPEAFDWLKVKYKKPIIYKSDRLKIYYKYAEELIKKGKAYVCSCPQEKLRENRANGIECGCRQLPVKIQMERWKQMFKKETKPGDFILRLKTDMQDKNPAFRDRVLFRISTEKHPKVGNKYKVWPMLEFSWAIDDHLLGITHVLRGKDLMIESEMEKFIWKIFKWKAPELLHAGMVRIEGMGAKLSKSKAQQEVKSGEFSGWDDPRTWSIQSLKRRGILPEAIRNFVEEIGLNNQDIIVPVESLYAINRKMIDSSANRYSFVAEPEKLKIKDWDEEIKEVEVKIHPDKPEKRTVKLGKDIFISEKDFNKFKGKEVRLMHLFNIQLGKEVKFTGQDNKDIPKLNWVSDFVNARILMPNGEWTDGIAESAVKKLKKGEVIQFERTGFVRFDTINKAGEYEFWFAHN